MLNEIIAFVLGFITAFILFAIIGYKQKKKLEQQIKSFDISAIQQLINWEEEEKKRDLEIGKDLKKKIKVEKNES
jgi:hypothetical protein